VVVGDFYIVRIAPRPAKADAPLVVDANAELAGAVTYELLQPIPRRDSQVVKQNSGIQLAKLSQCRPLHVRPQPPDRLTFKQLARLSVAEAPDHHLDDNASRYHLQPADRRYTFVL
jgi:hypothetical protein